MFNPTIPTDADRPPAVSRFDGLVEADGLAPRAGDPPPLLPPGEYDAYAEYAHFETFKFGRQKAERLVVRLEVRGGPYDGTKLNFYCPAPERKNGAFRRPVGARTKFYRSWVVANAGRQPERGQTMSLDVFRHKLFRIRVRTVPMDRNQSPLSRCNRYSIVDALVERIA
jgi:hypothetical protein